MTRSTRNADMEFTRAPSALLFMLRAFAPSPGLGAGLAPLAATWRDHRVDARQLAHFLSLSGLPAGQGLPLLYPQVIGFRLNMVVLTHPRFPLPIWQALQARNRIVQHAPLPLEACYTLRTEVSAPRVLEKGAEIDLLTTVCAGDVPVWEAINTFYFRGRYGAAQARVADAAAPRFDGETMARWRSRADVGWAMARLTGDYNGIHLWNGYARMFGFPRAFHHPQLMIAQCLARLAPAAEAPQELNIWLRGPVPYGADLRLDADQRDDEAVFALYAQDRRPAIIGRWRRRTPASAQRP